MAMCVNWLKIDSLNPKDSNQVPRVSNATTILVLAGDRLGNGMNESWHIVIL